MLYLISTAAYAGVTQDIKLSVNALSGLYLISTRFRIGASTTP